MSFWNNRRVLGAAAGINGLELIISNIVIQASKTNRKQLSVASIQSTSGMDGVHDCWFGKQHLPPVSLVCFLLISVPLKRVGMSFYTWCKGWAGFLCCFYIPNAQVANYTVLRHLSYSLQAIKANVLPLLPQQACSLKKNPCRNIFIRSYTVFWSNKAL